MVIFVDDYLQLLLGQCVVIKRCVTMFVDDDLQVLQGQYHTVIKVVL